MLGSYSVENGSLLFRPRFPLASGMRLRALFRGGGAPIEAVFDSPKADTAATTRVQQVYPSTDLLPDGKSR